jgi:PST family polysaccharide transporter
MESSSRRKSGLRNRIVTSLFSLYGLQMATLMLPLVLLPFLARRLGPEPWGLLAMFTSLSGIMIIVLEFGFGFGATRAVASNRDSPSRIAGIVADVVGARLLLTLVVCSAWVIIWFALPVVREASAAYWWMLPLTLVQGASFAWYFQAVGRLPYAAILDISARIVSTILILVFVRGAGDSGLVPSLQFFAIAITFTLTMHKMYESVPLKRPTLVGALKLLRSNSYISGLRIVQSMATMGNTFLLGTIAPGTLATYGAAERTSNAVRSIVVPVTQVGFPEFVAIAGTDRPRAQMYLRRVLLAMIGGSFVGTICLWFLADPIVLVLFGSKFGGAADVFRILALTLPLFAVSQTIGSQWMLAVGHDRPFFVAILSGFIVNVGLALIVVPSFGAVGMALSFAISECLVAIFLLVYVEFFAPLDSRIVRRAKAIASSSSDPLAGALGD